MISESLKKVILRILCLDDFDMQDTTLASEVPGWDSLTHVRILSEVEKAFSIRFRSLEILRLKNIGDLQKMVDQKLGK